nr:hypothetical protein [Amycolatopsis sp. WAC 04182]
MSRYGTVSWSGNRSRPKRRTIGSSARQPPAMIAAGFGGPIPCTTYGRPAMAAAAGAANSAAPAITRSGRRARIEASISATRAPAPVSAMTVTTNASFSSGDISASSAGEYLPQASRAAASSPVPSTPIVAKPCALGYSTAFPPVANTTSWPRSLATVARGSKGAMWL